MIPFAPGFFKPVDLFVPDVEQNFDGAAPSITTYTEGGGGTYTISDVYSGDTNELIISPASNGYPTTCRLNDISAVGPDFDIRWLQSQCSDNTDTVNTVFSGIVARTSNWQNPSGLGSYNWGLCVYLHRDGTLVLGRSTDSATAGGIASIASAASGLGAYPGGASTPLRKTATFRWRAVADSHKVWVDDVLKIDATSSYFQTNSGYIAFFTSPYAWTGLGSGVAGTNQGYPAVFDLLQIKTL